MSSSLVLSKVYHSQPGWYRGDFHAHTHFSDGVHSAAELVEVAKAEGLDFFAITDHNSIDAFPQFGDNPGILIIPGIEVTVKEGHCNVFGMEGANKWTETLLAGRPWHALRLDGQYRTLTAVMRAASAHGLLVSINHPLLKPWEWREGAADLGYVDCLEVWNDPSWPDNVEANPRTVALWTTWLNAGYRITAIGGSDYHRPAPRPGENKPAERLGLPSTYVYAEELSGKAILTGLRQRRAYVSMGPRVTFQARANGITYDIGADVGCLKGEIEFTAGVSGSLPAARVQIVKNGAVIAEAPLAGGQANLYCRDQADSALSAWYRLDVYAQQGQMLAITNPIFVGPARRPERRTFGDFVVL